MTSTSWTDARGITHLMLEISKSLQTQLYEPIREAVRRANASQMVMMRQIALGGVVVKPVLADEPDMPDLHAACDDLAWISRDKLDDPPRVVTCIDCLAAS